MLSKPTKSFSNLREFETEQNLVEDLFNRAIRTGQSDRDGKS